MRIVPIIKWQWQAMRGYKLPIALVAVLGMVKIALGLYFIWITREVIDIATGKTDGDLISNVILMVALTLIPLVMDVCSTWLSGTLGVRFTNNLRYRIYTQVMQSSWEGKERMHSGDMVNRLLGDVGMISDFLCGTIPSCMITIIQLLASSLMLYVLQPQLLWIIAIVMPFTALFSRMYFFTMRSLTRQIRDANSRVQETIQESLQNRIMLLALNGMQQSFAKMAGRQEDLKKLIFKRLKFSIQSSTFVRIGFTLGYLAAFLWGIFGLKEGSITFGTMMAFLQLVAQVQQPFSSLAHYIPSFVHAMTATERITDMTDLSDQEKAIGLQHTMQGPLGIHVEELTFTYPGNPAPTLKQLNFDFIPGTRTAIVGETGIGKSTLMRLLLALLKPQEGKIILTNEHETHPSDASTRCNFCMVPQGNSLLSGSIRENLLIGNPDATEKEMKEALYQAAAEFVEGLPNGLDTNCTEKGAGLSEGQAQRIAIARALLHRGSILIMDEASSALDEDTEKRIIDRLSARKDKTILWITHHRAVAEAMDAIVRL